MIVCIIGDERGMACRIDQALGDSGRDDLTTKVVRTEDADSHLLRQPPDVVVVAVGSDVEAAASMVARFRDFTPAQLIAVGPASDPRLVLSVLRAGAIDYVDESALEAELSAAMARLRFGQVVRAAPGRLVAVLSPSGGSGASLVAVNLAVAMAKAHERSLIIDLKSRSGDLAAMLDLKPTHSIQDLCRVATRIDRVLFEQTIIRHTSGASLLASPRSFNAALSAEAISRVVDLGRGLFPRIVADVDISLPEETLEALRLADAILVVMRLEFNSLRNAKTMLDHLERSGISPKKIAMVANRVGQTKEIPAAKIEEALERKFVAKIPDDPKAALSSQNNGLPALTEYPSSYLAKALRLLAAAVDSFTAPAANGS